MHKEPFDQCKSPKSRIGLRVRYCFDDIITNNPAMLQAKHFAKMAAENDSTVLLLGDTGTGKEMFAQAIHNASARSRGPFVAINFGAIPPNLIDTELFGYEEGAFTGAKKGGQPGKFELADGGTIFLDEIGEMPLYTQVTLLRILEDQQITRIGGCKAIPINTRIIAATNKDLRSEVEKGTFRKDLFYRLNVLTIRIPKLADRQTDILLLANHFIRRLNMRLKKNVTKMTREFKDWLETYSWPGNVRELKNLLERCIIFVEGDTLRLDDIPQDIRGLSNMSSKSTIANDQTPFSLEQKEKEMIELALREAHGNISMAAKMLGIGRNTIYRKIHKFKLENFTISQ